MLSGLNNLKVYTLLDNGYKDHFAFNEEEVTGLFKAQAIEAKLEDVKAWYNGYQSCDVVVYNPWSIICCLSEEGRLEPYWVNVAKNNLVKDIIIHSEADVKTQLENLMKGEFIEVTVDKHITFESIFENPSALMWVLIKKPNNFIMVLCWL